jgi:hypothetical protein
MNFWEFCENFWVFLNQWKLIKYFKCPNLTHIFQQKFYWVHKNTCSIWKGGKCKGKFNGKTRPDFWLSFDIYLWYIWYCKTADKILGISTKEL